MKTVLLLGELGKKFGRKIRLDVKTPAEAVRALCANFPDFERHLVDSEKRNVAYRVVVGKGDVRVDDLHNPAGNQTIKLVPVIQGAGGNGLFQTIIGAVLIAASFIPGNPFSGPMLNAGIAMVIGGTIQMLSPTPKAPDPSESPENQPSYVFNGAVNTTAQGQPVPIGYGRMIVGSAVISAGITTEEIPV